MAQGFTRLQTQVASPAQLRQALGFVPRRVRNSGVTAGVYGDGSSTLQITVDEDGYVTDVVEVPIDFPVPSFGAGAPAGVPADGEMYFDTTAAYVGYVGNGGTWHQF